MFICPVSVDVPAKVFLFCQYKCQSSKCEDVSNLCRFLFSFQKESYFEMADQVSSEELGVKCKGKSLMVLSFEEAPVSYRNVLGCLVGLVHE